MIRIVFTIGLLSAGMVTGQAPAPSSGAPAAAAKPLAFDVVSIRQNVSGTTIHTGMPVFGPTADGYGMTSMSLILPILTAYVPSTGAAAYTEGQVAGLPDWVGRDAFDIQAKVASEDLPEWQKPAAQKAMLQAMLQALLADRCKMVVHREVKDIGVNSLVVAKGGPKFKPTNPDETHEGMKLPFGGTMSPGKDGMSLYAAPMASVAYMLSSINSRGGTGRPIQDKTGLTGLYDIVLSNPDMVPPPSGPQDGSAASDPGSQMVSTLLDSLGLKLESTKAPVETLIIDHIEKPSQN